MRALLLTLLPLIASPALAQEKFVGTNMDTRTILNFRVSDAALQKLVPAGWEVNPATTGPSAGANARVTFVDQIQTGNAERKSVPPVRNLIFGIPVKKTGSTTSGLMIFAGLSPVAGGPYGASIEATNAVERKISHSAAGQTVKEESWEYKSNTGYTVTMQAQYVRNTATREKSELLVFAQPKPDFYRIYRYEQGTDVVRGAGVTDRLQKFSFKATGEKLSPLFDGTEQLISFNSVPFYAREIYLPGS